MFYARILLLALFACPVLASAAEPVRLQAAAQLSAVIVYPDRAMTTRNAALMVKKGAYLVAFEGLPALIQDESIRVTGKGSAAVTILETKVRRSFMEQVPEKRAEALGKEIRDLNRTIAGLDAKRAALVAQKTFIDSIKVAWSDRISKELSAGKPTSAELNEALAFVGTGVTRVEQQTYDIDEEKRQLGDQVDALQRQRREAIGSSRKEAKTVEVSLEVAREGSLTLALTSVTPQASWEPSYDARLASDGKSVELTFRALVRQHTGEDWRDVNLSLSTARPALGGAPPDLAPWRVSFYRPPVAAAAPAERLMKVQQAPAPAPALAKAKDASDGGDTSAKEAPAAYMNAEISAEQNSVSFVIPRPTDIPSDGTQHGSFVASDVLPITLEFLAVPKLSPNVYLKSEIVNHAAYPLLPGQVSIFTGGSYTGSARLKRVAAGEKFDLFFGADDQVTIKREETKSHKEAGLFGKNRMEYRCRIEVQNLRKEPQTITIRDQMPVAGDEEIKVTLDEPSLKPVEIGRDGTLTWKLPVQSGEKGVLTFGIGVEYPKERRVVGF